MELLISILMWLGLITGGTTYTAADIERIEAENRTVINAKRADYDQAGVVVSQSNIDLIIHGR
ncbi:MAG: hypothetical protein RL594_467 [Bacteroidota bacterium]|jgi:hypothetical protein